MPHSPVDAALLNADGTCSVKHVAWINLDRRPDRRAHMENLFSGCHVPHTRIPAIDGKQPSNAGKRRHGDATTILKQFVTNAEDMCLPSAMNDAEVACTLSHLKAMHFLASLQPASEDDVFLMLEDDVTLTSSLRHFAPYPVANIVRNAPTDFEILLLHHICGRQLVDEYTKLGPNGSEVFSTAAYVFTRSFLRKVMSLVNYDPETNRFTFHRPYLTVADSFFFSTPFVAYSYRWNVFGGSSPEFETNIGGGANEAWVAVVSKRDELACAEFAAVQPSGVISWPRQRRVIPTGAAYSPAEDLATNIKAGMEETDASLLSAALLSADGNSSSSNCISHIAWINLDRRPDRRAHMESLLADCRVPHTRISAIDGQEHDRGNARTLSHLKALHFLASVQSSSASTADTSNDRFLVLEDDVRLDTRMIQAAALETIVRRAPSNFDVLTLHHRCVPIIRDDYTRIYYKSYEDAEDSNYSTKAYVINRRAILCMLNLFSFDPIAEKFEFHESETKIGTAAQYLFSRLSAWSYRWNIFSDDKCVSTSPSTQQPRPACLEHVVYINLDRSVARRERMESQLSDFGLPYSRLRAIEPADFPGGDWRAVATYDSGAPVKTVPGFDLNAKEVACTLSHLKAMHFLSTLTEDDSARFLVLEDDADFWNAKNWFAPSDFGESPLSNILRRAPANFEILLLHHLIEDPRPKHQKSDAEFYQCGDRTIQGGVFSSMAYVITRGAIRKLMTECFSVSYVDGTDNEKTDSRIRFRFRDKNLLNHADRYAYHYCNTWFYKYNFFTYKYDLDSTIGHDVRFYNQLNFVIDRQMSLDAAAQGQNRIVFEGAPEPTYAFAPRADQPTRDEATQPLHLAPSPLGHRDHGPFASSRAVLAWKRKNAWNRDRGRQLLRAMPF